MSMNSASLDADPVAPSGSGTPNARSPEEVVATATPAVRTPNYAEEDDARRYQPTSQAEGNSALTFHEVQYKDGGAHWYRASAIILKYHRWFNQPCSLDTGKPPELLGNVISSPHGIRLVELRSLPEGVVFHHWEFPHDKPRLVFQLKYAKIKDLSPNADQITVLTEDNYGNILKVKLKLEAIQDDL